MSYSEVTTVDVPVAEVVERDVEPNREIQVYRFSILYVQSLSPVLIMLFAVF